jgi:hypothetical protein
MRGFRGKISGSKIGNSGNKGGHRGLTRAGRSRQSRRRGGRRMCPSAPLARDAPRRWRPPRPLIRGIVAMAYDQEAYRMLLTAEQEAALGVSGPTLYPSSSYAVPIYSTSVC